MKSMKEKNVDGRVFGFLGYCSRPCSSWQYLVSVERAKGPPPPRVLMNIPTAPRGSPPSPPAPRSPSRTRRPRTGLPCCASRSSPQTGSPAPSAPARTPTYSAPRAAPEAPSPEAARRKGTLVSSFYFPDTFRI